MNVNFEFIDKYITCKYIIVTNYYFSVVLKEPLQNQFCLLTYKDMFT
jgi:hypothetical protein